MHFARITVVLPLIMLLVGCSNGGDKPVPQFADGVSGDKRDSSGPDGSDLFELWSEAGTVFDSFRSADAVATGEPGYPCADFDDCLSGWCVTTSDGKKCSVECLDECPFGWSCTLHKPSLPDEIYICAPTMMNLCKPCNANADCATNGVDVGDACVPFEDEGSFTASSSRVFGHASRRRLSWVLTSRTGSAKVWSSN